MSLRLGYPLWLLKLSLATYRLQRIIRIGSAVFGPIRANLGITAGSGFATSEMRLLMINVVDEALQQHPSATPTLFVD